jgi:hypothetical protein
MSQPRRAESARLIPASESPQTAVNENDSNILPDAWFAYVMPTQSGVEMMGAGRYGYWEDQPSIAITDDCIVIRGNADGETETEPILVLPSAAIISVLLAQVKHVNAAPAAPVLEVEG